MKQQNTKGMRFPSNGLYFLLLNLLLGLCMTIGSVLYQRNPEPGCHTGGLGAGFPLPFVCDDTGGSPITSWGRIDLSDIGNVNSRVFLLDLLLYNALVSLIWTAVLGILYKGTSKAESSHWALVLCITFILGFLFVFLSFQSGHLNFEISIPATPMPFNATPTPFGIPSFPSVAPT